APVFLHFRAIEEIQLARILRRHSPQVNIAGSGPEEWPSATTRNSRECARKSRFQYNVHRRKVDAVLWRHGQCRMKLPQKWEWPCSPVGEAVLEFYAALIGAKPDDLFHFDGANGCNTAQTHTRLVRTREGVGIPGRGPELSVIGIGFPLDHRHFII